MTRRVLFFIIVCIAGFLVSCSEDPGPADALVQQEVTGLLETLKGPDRGILGQAVFSHLFVVDEIRVLDRLVKDREATVICELHIRVIKDFQRGSTFSISFPEYYGEDRAGKVGDTRVVEKTFRFQRFDQGWRLDVPEP